MALKLNGPSREYPVRLLPGYCFFTESLAIPESLEENGITDYVELSLEELSPFSLDHLHWGFVSDEASQKILIYAAWRHRLDKLGLLADIDEQRHLIPDFVAFLGLREPDSVWHFFQSEQSLSALYFEPNCAIPTKVESIQLEEDASFSAIYDARNKLAAQLPNDGTCIDAGLTCLDRCTATKQACDFHFKRYLSQDEEQTPNPINTLPADTQLWRADVRDQNFVQNKLKEMRLDDTVNKGFKIAAMAACVLIACKFALFIGQSFLDARIDKVNARYAEVQEVLDQQALIKTLNTFSEEELRPFAILEQLNQKRMPSIYFEDVIFESGNIATVNGVAPSIKSLNDYIAQLRNSGAFKKITINKSETDFTITLEWNPSSAASVEPLASAHL